MLITVTGVRDPKFESVVHKAAKFYASILLPKHISAHITVDIDFMGKLDRDADGYCDVVGYNIRKKPREFEIQIRRNKSKRYMMMTLAHEFVHLKQYAMGELDDNMSVWKGKKVRSNVDYWDSPWEIEAHGREYGLWSRFAKKFKVRYKRTQYERDN